MLQVLRSHHPVEADGASNGDSSSWRRLGTFRHAECHECLTQKGATVTDGSTTAGPISRMHGHAVHVDSIERAPKSPGARPRCGDFS